MSATADVGMRLSWQRLNWSPAVRSVGPALLFGIRLWASVSLALYVSFWLQLDNPYWAGTSAAIVCQPQLGASLRKGWFRMVGTVTGAIGIVVLTAFFPQERMAFLFSLALWAAACAFVGTLLRNFAAYAAALAGYTAVIIASDQLGATGGLDGQAFMLAITRASEIGIGIVCAGIVLAGTDLGGAPRRLSALIADLMAEFMRRFFGLLEQAGPHLPQTQPVRRELIRRVIALEPIIDQAIGESSQLRYHSPLLQKAVDGLFAGLAGWRTIAVRLELLPDEQARREAASIVDCIPSALRSILERGQSEDCLAEPVEVAKLCRTAVDHLDTLATDCPSKRLLADQTSEVLAGLACALDGLALLVADPKRRAAREGTYQLRTSDVLPSCVNAGRAFVTICAMELFWIITGWPNGASAIVFATINVVLLSLRGDRAYTSALGFMIGTMIAAAFAAIVAFAALPGLETFASFCVFLGFYLIPVGAMMTQPWQTGIFTSMTANFIPLLAPANQMNYDPQQFYNTALAIIAGSAAAALSFRLFPPLSPELRMRRLLQLALRDLRQLATRPVPDSVEAWQSRMYGRLAALPDQAPSLQRAWLLATLSVGTEILQLRRIAARLGSTAQVEPALESLAHGNITLADVRLGRVDERLASGSEDVTLVLRGRARVLALREALSQHAAYFGSPP